MTHHDDAIAEKDERIAKLVTLLDAQMGTPCEQIRHAQEVAERDEQIARLEADLRMVRAALAAITGEKL
jgi:hypothetical protein